MRRLSTIARLGYAELCFGLCIFGSAAHAGEAPPHPADVRVPVTLDRVLEMVDRHPFLQSKQHDIAAARAAIESAGRPGNPTIEAATGVAQARKGDDARVEWGLTLSMPLGFATTRNAKKSVARAALRQVTAELTVLRRTLREEASRRFFEVAHAEVEVAVLSALLAQTETLRHTVEIQVEKGDIRPVAALRIAVEVEKIAAALDAAETELSGKAAELGLFLGMESGRVPVTRETLSALPAVMSRAQAVSMILKAHPDLTVAAASIRLHEAKQIAAKRARAPDVDVSLFTDQELDKSAYGLGLSLELPFFDRNQGEIGASEQRTIAAKKTLEATRTRLTMLAVNAQAACDAGAKRAKRFKETIVPKAEAAARVIDRTYALGEAPLIDVIDARRTLLETERAYLEAAMTAQIDCSALRILVGEEVTK